MKAVMKAAGSKASSTPKRPPKKGTKTPIVKEEPSSTPAVKKGTSTARAGSKSRPTPKRRSSTCGPAPKKEKSSSNNNNNNNAASKKESASSSGKTTEPNGKKGECVEPGRPGTLYEILGVPKDAKPREIILAYRKRARECHPDKNKEKGAKAAFQSIARAYEILSKPETREQYDRGTLDPDGCDLTSAFDYLSRRFQPVTAADIDEFANEYRGSEEEKEDLVEYYNKTEGDMSKIDFEFLLCELEHIPRLMDLVHTLILERRVKNTPFFCSTERLMREKARRRMMKQRAGKQKNIGPRAMDQDLVALIRNKNRTHAGPPKGGVLERLWDLVPDHY